jgi:hypothetical protein
MSSYEQAKGYTRPVTTGVAPVTVPDSIRASRDELIAKRKLNLILKSKNIADIGTHVGGIVGVCVHATASTYIPMSVTFFEFTIRFSFFSQ